MERPGLNLLDPGTGNRRRAELPQPSPQFTGRPGGEGDREHSIRSYDTGHDRVGDPVRDRPRFARARAGQHTDRPAGRQRHLPLLGVERRQYDIGTGVGVSGPVGFRQSSDEFSQRHLRRQPPAPGPSCPTLPTLAPAGRHVGTANPGAIRRLGELGETVSAGQR